MATLQNILFGILSSDNKTRLEAETALQQYTLTNPNNDEYALSLVSIIQGNNNDGIRKLAAIILRQTIKNNIWSSVTEQTKQLVKDKLLVIVPENINNNSLTKILIHTISNIATVSDWPQLYSTLHQFINYNNILVQICGLEMLNTLLISCYQFLTKYISSDQLERMFIDFLNDSNALNIRLAALKCLVTYLFVISSMDKKKQRIKILSTIVPLILSSLNAALQVDEVSSLEILIQLNEILQIQPSFFKQHLKELVIGLSSLVSNTQLPISTRKLCMEVLLSLVEEGKGMVRKLDIYSDTVIPLAFQMLLEVSTEEWSLEAPEDDKAEDESLDEDEAFQKGLESIYRLSNGLGKLFFDKANSYVSQLLAQQSWIHRHAALMAIAEMTEGCRKQLVRYAVPLVVQIVGFISDPHPRVKYAAITALKELASGIAPKLQRECHSEFCNSLNIVFANCNEHPRVTIQACMALINFIDESIDDACVIKPYACELLNSLAYLINGSTNWQVKTNALFATAGIAHAIGTDFFPFYRSSIDFAITLITNCKGDDYLSKSFVSKAIRSIGLIGDAVGSSVFREDAIRVLKMLYDLQNSGISITDPQFESLAECCQRICDCIGEEFIPYIPVCIPPLINGANIESGLQIVDKDESNSDGLTVRYQGVGDKVVSIDSAAIQVKIFSTRLLFLYLKKLHEHLYPYFNHLIEIMGPLTHYPLETIRIVAIQSCAELLVAAEKFVKRNPSNVAGNPINDMFEKLYPHYKLALVFESQPENLLGSLNSLETAINVVKDSINDKQLNDIVEALTDVLDQSNSRRSAIHKERKDEDCDLHSFETLNEDEGLEDDIVTCAIYVIKALEENVHARFVPHFHNFIHCRIYPTLQNYLNPPSIPLLIATICLYDDAIELCQPQSLQYSMLPEFFPCILKHFASDNFILRQAAVYGLGVFAQIYPINDLQQIILYLKQLILPLKTELNTSQQDQEDDNTSFEDARCCALSTVAKICKYQTALDLNLRNDLLSCWLFALPAKGDEEEALVVHNFLISYIKENNPIILANTNQIYNIFKVIHNSQFSNDEINAFIDFWYSCNHS